MSKSISLRMAALRRVTDRLIAANQRAYDEFIARLEAETGQRITDQKKVRS